ncbi:hypothetical protein AX769_18085 [Frondihabitans sp. PAMC 28766]|uniref:glycosyltransferase family 2 protein n=1 Tax=Frondihabitans sp. PAMC 28766 TaxID=1795630 RepID=UPI00078E1709|nr:hypothetical protein [Frondihabitans sp. PAMC 28766]AMM21708.1 hypothetical protein AX769_18085 [Frondihabitans sp. PAMC 28766]
MTLVVRERARQAVRRAGAEALYDRLILAARRLKAVPRERAWLRVVGGLLHDGVVVHGSGGWARPEAGVLPLVMCLWNRPERIDEVLAMLRSLSGPHRVALLLWNNNAADADFYAGRITDAAGGSLAGVDLVQSPVNIGGLARFVAARLLANGGYTGPVLMLDDDQDVSPNFVEDLLRDYSERSVVAWWAFSLHGSYWRRAEIEPGSDADHAGTGGTVYDSSLVRDDRFFANLPREFAFLEDQWMTFLAHAKGWRVIKGRTTIDLVSEEKNQYHGLSPLKDRFYRVQRTQRAWLTRRARVRTAWNDGRITSEGVSP